MLSRDRRLFFLRWLKSPRRMGSFVPSSRNLARAMAAQLSKIEPHEYIVELGPGTGVVTKALIQSGIAPDRLIVIERDEAFINQLKSDFPSAHILQADACDLIAILARYGITEVAAVVSSLPLLSLPDRVRQIVIRESFKVLKATGAFVQFTYGLHSPVPKQLQHSVGIDGRIAKRIWRNFPPARVWRYTARDEVFA